MRTARICGFGGWGWEGGMVRWEGPGKRGIGSQWGMVSVQIWHIVSKICECIAGEPEGLSLIRFTH